MFRDELATWLQHHDDTVDQAWVSPESAQGYERRRMWQRRFFDAGYMGLTWPEEYGGSGRAMGYQAIFLEEVARAGVPTPLNIIGLNMVGPTIITHGTESQKQRYLRAILRGDEIWCQGFSEADAGSDVAAVRTRARPTANGSWVVTGQKIWTSLSPIADQCLLLARTGDTGAGRRGLTCFLVDMHALGVTVSPIVDATGDAPFGEVRFQEVEVGPEEVLGEVGDGWRVAITTLGYERANLGATLGADARERYLALVRLLEDRLASRRSPELLGRVREQLGVLGAEVLALQLTAERMLSDLGPGEVPDAASTVLKLKWTAVNQQLTALALDLLGPDAFAHDTVVPGGERWMYEGMRALANSIEGGTSQILRSLVAERVLGLPRSR